MVALKFFDGPEAIEGSTGRRFQSELSPTVGDAHYYIHNASQEGCDWSRQLFFSMEVLCPKKDL